MDTSQFPPGTEVEVVDSSGKKQIMTVGESKTASEKNAEAVAKLTEEQLRKSSYEKAPQPEKQTVHLNKTLAQRYAQWTEAHGTEKPAPIYIDEQTNEPRWITRKQRRAMASQIRRLSKG